MRFFRVWDFGWLDYFVLLLIYGYYLFMGISLFLKIFHFFHTRRGLIFLLTESKKKDNQTM